jgi:hypothetical protein
MNSILDNKIKYKSIILPNKKESILHFLPIELNFLTKINKIQFNKKKLKTTYLLDIISNMILKYYFKKENLFALNATVLKSKYGYYYNYYIDFLVQEGYITKVLNHKSGITSRLYCLNESLLSNKINRHKTFDKILSKKFLVNFLKNSKLLNNDIFVSNNTKERLISDLFKVNIDKDNSILYLNNIKENLDVYNRNIYSIEAIHDKHIFYHFDKYGRLHTNFTILKSSIRKSFLRIDNEETSEIDIANSQPLFLAKLIYEINTKWVDKEELDKFIFLTTSGRYYQYLMDNLNINNKKEIKEITYKILFGRNHHNSKYDRMFKKLFPTIHNFIKLFKSKNNDYRSLSHELQKMESNFIFNNVVKKIYEYSDEISIITIHDSIIMKKSNKNIVKTIFENEKNAYFIFK